MIQNSVDMPSWSLGKLTKLNGRRRSGGGGGWEEEDGIKAMSIKLKSLHFH